ncbi:hypothetical protein FQN57_004467 [Myotisia sp. PD_48]|nr:hypothetical protein FQN57_004467 [Myotisia sp. PD_48]
MASESESYSSASSSPSSNTPDDQSIESALREAVATTFKSGNLEELTVKRIRLAVEARLGLEDGFLKNHESWKPRSAEIIKDEVEIQESAPPSEKPSNPKKKTNAPSTKRARSEKSGDTRKKRKQDAPSLPQEKASNSIVNSPTSSVADQEIEAPVSPPPISPKASHPDSESEMSVLLDEEPKPKRKNPPIRSSSGSQNTSKTKKLSKPDLDPDQAEIKRLQGWLVKCGIRKMWFRELAPYETPKAKIRHLKEMLKDAGMEGRYSLDKANQIREERELKADLETVQEGAKRWGKMDQPEETKESGRPSRRVAKTFQSLNFLSEGDEESE